MAFLSKVGGILRQSVCKQVDLHLSSSSPSVFQAIRRMSSSKVFIGGLSYSTDDTSLQEAFAKYGNVVDAKVIVDRDTNRSRGFGFVTYTSSEEASSAIQALDQQDLHGRRVRVAYATERSRSAGFGGGYGAGGGGYGAGGGGYGTGGGGGSGSGGYGGGAGYGGYGDAGGYGGGSANYGGNGGSYGGYGGSGSGSQGGVNGYGSGGATYGGGSLSTGDNPGGYNAGGYGGGSGGSYGAAGGGGGANFDVSGGTGGNVTSDTSFASSGFEGGSGLGYSGGSSSDPIGTSGLEDSAGNYEANEPLDRDDRDEDEPDDYAKRA